MEIFHKRNLRLTIKLTPNLNLINENLKHVYLNYPFAKKGVVFGWMDKTKVYMDTG